MSEVVFHQIECTSGLEYTVHDGVRLVGDLYQPAASDPVPLVIAVHGGAWKVGDAKDFQYWGPWLAARGIAVYSIEYRLVRGEANRYPAAVLDVRSAIQFARANAAKLRIDPARVALMGASAGAHLSALVALAGDRAPFQLGHSDDRHKNISTRVTAVVAAYGIYDMLAQWEHDQLARPYDQITELFLGRRPTEDKFPFYESSPIAYTTSHANKTAFLLTWGTNDDVVDWQTQSWAFMRALKQAGYPVRTIPVQAAPHFWMYAPLDELHGHAGFVAPQVLRFLKEHLG
jgi:acetyl esterase/lipase